MPLPGQENPVTKSPSNGKIPSPDELVQNADSFDDQVPPLAANGGRPRSILKLEGASSSPLAERTVSWQDFQGKELQTVREFVPRWGGWGPDLYHAGQHGPRCGQPRGGSGAAPAHGAARRLHAWQPRVPALRLNSPGTAQLRCAGGSSGCSCSWACPFNRDRAPPSSHTTHGARSRKVGARRCCPQHR
jgi:hypothetical protein